MEAIGANLIIDGKVPNYYTIEQCGDLDKNYGLIIIRYFAFFGFQYPCQTCTHPVSGKKKGYHQGGFEEAAVV